MKRENAVLKDSLNKDIFYEALKNIEPEIEDITNSINKIESKSLTNSGSFMNFSEIKKQSNLKASKIVKSIVATYIDDELQKDNFVIRKRNMDIMMFSQLLYQAITAEYAVTKLLELLDEGNLSPRMFEVLPGLQKSLMEVNKQILTTQNVIEITYKNLNHEFKNVFMKRIETNIQETQNLLVEDNVEENKKTLEDELLEVI